MKKLLIFIAPLMLLFAAACEEKPQEKQQMQKDIYTNPDAEVCGLKDPVNNIPWLKDINDSFVREFNHYVDENNYYEYILSVYENNTTKDKYFVIRWFSNYYIAYDCSQNEPFIAGIWEKENLTSTQSSDTQNSPLYKPMCKGCDEFFEQSTFLYDLARYQNLSIK